MGDKKTKFNKRLEKRLLSELEDIRNANMKDISDIQIDDKDNWSWNVLLAPHCVPYNKGAFRIEIIFPENFPFKPPSLLFHTKIYHPNVDEKGYLHLELLTNYWSPAMQMEQVLRGLIAVVNKPQPHHPFHPEISKLSRKYKDNHEEFIKTAIEMTEKFSEKRPDDTDTGIPKAVGLVADRLRNELKEIQEANMKCFKNIRVVDIWTWTGLVVPDCPPYKKGEFRFEVEIPPEYPVKPPEIYFLTKIYHPNVYENGKVDMRETCVEWGSTRKMIEVFRALRRIFSEPDVDHFPSSETGQVYLKNREMFLRTAEEFTKQFARKESSEEFRLLEGKCLAFEGTAKEITMAVNSLAIEEGKCLEIKCPPERKQMTNTENTLKGLSDKMPNDDCYEPEGKCLPFGGSSVPI